MVLYPNKLPESERVCSGICRISEYSKLEIPIPPQKEQKRIVFAVHSIFAKLDMIMESL